MKVTTLKGIFPDPKPVTRKNFIQENVRNLRRMEQCFQSNKEIDKLEKLQLHKHKARDKYQNVSAKVVTSFRDKTKHEQRNDIAPVPKNPVPVSVDNVKDEKLDRIGIGLAEPCKKYADDGKKAIRTHTDNDTSSRQKKSSKHKSEQKQPKDSSKPSILQKYADNTANDSDAQIDAHVKYKSQGIQTLDTDEIESIYSEGIILYPSKKVTKRDEMANKGDLNRQEETALRKQSDSPNDRGDMRTPEDSRKTDLWNSVSPAVLREEIDFVKLNKERTTVATKLATQLNNGVPPPNYRKGVVPKYLRDRKEAIEKEQKAKAEASHDDCPDGHVSLPDHERRETLRLLKKNYQDYINELNMMPIKTDTLRAQRRKMEIEKQLNKLEEGIKVFSRPKVYVKINA